MEDISLEDLWCLRLSHLGWSEEAISNYCCAWAPRTKSSYNCMLNKCAKFCQEIGVSFPPMNSKDLASFVCRIAKSSESPRAQLVTLSAALGSLYLAMGKHNMMQDHEIQTLMTGSVKVGTNKPATKSSVMPIAPIRRMVYSLGKNYEMSLSDLRMKAIVTLALTFMLRPSDIAPRTMELDSESNSLKQRVFKDEQVRIVPNTSITIKFHGIKNDTSRSGFEVCLPAASDKSLDPVVTLSDYMERTAAMRAQVPDHPVFITLNAPYHAISADTVRNIMDTAITKSGLGNQGYSAKCYRPTGATYSIAMGYDPEIIMRIGRWKTRSVFFDHYVHSQVPSNYSSNLLAQN